MITVDLQGHRTEMPWAWEDVGPVAWPVLRALARRPGHLGKLEALRLLLGVNKQTLRRIDPTELVVLTDALPVLNGTGMRAPIRQRTRVGLRYYYWPCEDFLDGQAMAYALADQYYEEALTADGDAAAATATRHLIAVLARPWRDQDRALIGSVEEVEARARRFRRLPPEWHLQALLYWTGVRDRIDELYGDHLFRPGEYDKPPARPITTFGWWSQFRFVAAERVFGNVADVERANFHEVCQFLVEKESVRRANQAEMEKINRRHAH